MERRLGYNGAFWARVLGQSLRRRVFKSYIIVIGITVSVAALVFLQAFLSGVDDRMIYNIARFANGDVTAWWTAQGPDDLQVIKKVRSFPSVEVAAIRSSRYGVLSHGHDRITPVYLMGCEPDIETHFGVMQGGLEAGRFARGPDEIVLCKGMADRLKTHVDDVVHLWVSTETREPLRVVGIVDAEFGTDPFMAITSLTAAEGTSLQISALLNSPGAADQVASRLREMLPEGASLETWDQKPTFFAIQQLIQLQRAASVVVAALVAVILAFGISSTMVVSVAERTREFGILRTVGVGPWGIVCLLTGETMLLTATGALLGEVLGICAVWILSLAGGIDLEHLMGSLRLFARSSVINPRLTFTAVLLPLSAALVSGLLASFLPARRASRISVVEALRTI